MRFAETRLQRSARKLLDRFRLDRLRPRLSLRMFRSLGVASGKGGTGKTFVSVNLGILIARDRPGALLLDADLGLANAHLNLGLRPAHNLQDYFDNDVALADLVLSTRYGLRLLSGGSGISRLADLDARERRRLADDLPELVGAAAPLLVDSAAGISPQTLLFLLCTDIVVLVVTPELTSITDAYALIKCLSVRRPECRFGVVVNRTDDESQSHKVFARLSEVVQRFLRMPLHFLGGIPEDRAVRSALAAKVPLVVRAPRADAARGLRAVAAALETWVGELPQDPVGFAARLHDLA